MPRAGVPTRYVFGATVQDNRLVFNGHSWAESYLAEHGRWTFVDPFRPIIATFGRDGEDMLLVEPGSVAALAAGLERLARDAGLRRRLARAARGRVEREHGFASRMERVRAVYDRLLDGAP